MNIPRIHFGVGRLDGNHHGPKGPGGRGGGWNFTTKRSTVSIVPLGRDWWLRREGRRCFGRRLYFYGPSGACVNFDIILRFPRSPYPAGHKFGPEPEATVNSVML